MTPAAEVERLRWLLAELMDVALWINRRIEQLEAATEEAENDE